MTDMKAEFQQGETQVGALDRFLDELVGRDRPIPPRRHSSERARRASRQAIPRRRRRAAPAAKVERSANSLDAFLNKLVGHGRSVRQRRDSSAREFRSSI